MPVGIDVGSHKICTLMGETLPGGGVRVLGIGHAPAAGIRGGEIIHVEDAAGAIAASIERAERVARAPVERAVIGLSGVHLQSSDNRAVVPCGRRPRQVVPSDVDRVLEAASTVPLAAGRELLHVLPRGFSIDDGSTVSSPVGMEGCRLAVEVHLVTASAAVLTSLRRCLELAAVEVDSLVMSTLAAAEATLTNDERQLGVFLVDLGHSSTGVACYRDGSLVHSAVLPVGGRHLTNDLAVMLQTPLAAAERIKITHGHVLPELDDETTIQVEGFGDGESRTTTRRLVSEILAARADEIASLVWAELEQADLANHLPAGAVLVGGSSELGGLARRFATQWPVAVRLGRPTRLVGLTDIARGAGHAGAVGLLAWQGSVVDAATPGAVESSSGVSRLLEWAKAAFLPRGGHRR